MPATITEFVSHFREKTGRRNLLPKPTQESFSRFGSVRRNDARSSAAGHQQRPSIALERFHAACSVESPSSKRRLACCRSRGSQRHQKFSSRRRHGDGPRCFGFVWQGIGKLAYVRRLQPGIGVWRRPWSNLQDPKAPRMGIFLKISESVLRPANCDFRNAHEKTAKPAAARVCGFCLSEADGARTRNHRIDSPVL